MRRLHPAQQRGQAGVDAVAGLMRAVIRIGAEEMVKLHNPFVQPHVEIQLGHGELVLIGEKDAFGRLAIDCCIHFKVCNPCVGAILFAGESLSVTETHVHLLRGLF